MKRIILFPVYGLLLGGVFFALLLASNLHTYYRLTNEVPVAELTFRNTGPRIFEATISWGDFCTEEHYMLHGEQWRLDARFLKWRPWANLLGLNAMYRIERLGGRYLVTSEEDSNARLTHDLSISGLPDLTAVLARYGGPLSPVDTLYGSSVYDRMDERHVFRVYRGQAGLLVRKHLLPVKPENSQGITIPINTACGNHKINNPVK